MNLNIDRKSHIPLYLQIKVQIRDMIYSGLLPTGYLLPPERKLAAILDVNRSTVVNAYDELKADGLAASFIGVGTKVLPVPNELHASDAGSSDIPPVPWRQLLSERGMTARDPLISELLELINGGEVINFAAGVPAAELYPMKTVRKILLEMVKEKDYSSMLHGPTSGYYPLKETICSLMKARQTEVQPEEVMVLAGSQQGLDLLARTLLDPGDVVVVEEPTYFSAIQTFKAVGAKLVDVPSDEEGNLRLDVLESVLIRYRPKFIYVLPTFQNPSGRVMSLKRRRQLLALAYRYQVPIIEDDPYYDLRYEGEPIPTIKSLDAHDYVIYLSTFSKILFPGLRVGWLSGPRALIRQISLTKQMADLHSNSLSQQLLDRFCRLGLLDEHLHKVRHEYKLRRDAMIEALEAYAVPGMEWNVPQGGFFVWCRIPERPHTSKLFMKAAEHRIAFVPGDVFFIKDNDDYFIRLNFTSTSQERIRTGIRLLMEAFRQAESDPKRIGVAEVNKGNFI